MPQTQEEARIMEIGNRGWFVHKNCLTITHTCVNIRGDKKRKEWCFLMYKNSKLYSVISYITWIGFLIALVGRDKNDNLVWRHLNQALIINIISSIGSFLIRMGGLFYFTGEIIDLAAFILFVMGIVRAFKMSEEPLPIIGEITLLN